MSVQETEDQEEALLSRPLYMGADRAEALNKDEAESAFDVQEEDTNEELEDKDLGTEELTFKKRYGDARRHMSKIQNELKEAKAALITAQEATPTWTPPASDEALDKFKESNPEAFDVLETVAHNRATASMDEVKALRAELEQEKLSRDEDSAATILLTRHPDFNDIRDTAEFHDWAETQSKTLQDGIYANTTDGELASRILDLYKLDLGLTSDKANDAKIKAAKLKEEVSKLNKPKGKSTVTSNKRTFTNSEIERMTMPEYLSLEEEIKLANIEGRIDVDR